jgi:hypothetical protein
MTTFVPNGGQDFRQEIDLQQFGGDGICESPTAKNCLYS